MASFPRWTSRPLIENLLPDQLSLLAAGILVFASFFTSALTAAAGIGGGLLMLALMAYLIPATAIIPVHGLVQLGSNASRTWVQREHINWRLSRIFLAGSVVGAGLGILLAVQLREGLLEAILGLFIVLMVWIKMPTLRDAGTGTIGLGGFFTTFLSMFIGATGPLVAVFLKNLFDKHREMVATHASAMVLQHGIKVIAFGIAGFAFFQWLPMIAVMVLSGFLGVKAGTAAMNKLPEKTLKLLFKVVLTLIALDLLRRGIMGIASG